jgi:hypothetical protein
MADMLRVVLIQSTEKIVTRNLMMARKTVVVLMRDSPLRGYLF